MDTGGFEKGEMNMQAPDVISRYFVAGDRREIDEVVRLFSDDAVVTDEDRTWRGASGVRAWRDGPAAAHEYTTVVQRIEPAGDGAYIARIRLEGNFPGGIADLQY